MDNFSYLARPDLPRPNCRVKLVCGPPAGGKTTYVHAHAVVGDIIIDVDAIAREQAFDRDRPRAADFLQERNRRLAALADERPDRVAWVIVGAPSQLLRQWWTDTLNAENVIVLTATRDELRHRILNDPDRRYVCELQFRLVDKWLDRERANEPGVYQSGVDARGFPTDPLHPWNRDRQACPS
jgi:hypothetical protein